jgi:hypothetical protein
LSWLLNPGGLESVLGLADGLSKYRQTWSMRVGSSTLRNQPSSGRQEGLADRPRIGLHDHRLGEALQSYLENEG